MWIYSRGRFIFCNRAGSIFGDLLGKYFKEVEGLTGLKAKVKGVTKQNWYEIVDGGHTHAALLKSSSEDEG